MISVLLVPPLSPTVAFLLICVKVCLKKLAFSKFLSKLYDMALSNKKSTFALVSGFFGCYTFTVLPKYYLKGCLFIKKASYLPCSLYFMLNLQEKWLFRYIYLDKGSNSVLLLHEIKNFRIKKQFFLKL